MTEDNRYKQAKIYTIRCRNDDTLIYVGSTIQPLHKRWYDHKIRVFNQNDTHYNIFLYKKIRETNNIDDWYIELHEDFPCSRKEQLEKREGEIIREIGTLNKRREGTSENDTRNVEFVTCECGCVVCKRNLERHMKTKKHQNILNNK